MSGSATDLSTRAHQPLTRLFAQIDDDGVKQKFTLTEEQLAHYREHGYVTGLRLFWGAHSDSLRAQLDSLMDPSPEMRHVLSRLSDSQAIAQSGLFHVNGAWRAKHGFHDLVWYAGLLIPAIQILDGNIRLWQDQVFVKPPLTGAAIGWHQEAAYWNTIKPIQHVSIWIALDDTDETNGCLRVAPGSHKWGLVPGQPATPPADLNAIQSLLSDEQKAQFKDVPLPTKKGYAIIMDPYLLHASGENKSEAVRRAVSVTLMKSGVKSETNDPVIPGAPVIKKGKKVEGEVFPLLYKAPKEEAAGVVEADG